MLAPMRPWSGLVASGLLACATIAHANVSSRLVYARRGVAERCPDEISLRKAVAERLGYDPFVASAPQTVVVRMTGLGEKLRAEIDLVDERGITTGSRVLAGKARQCDELLRSLALTLSITLDPMSVDRPEPPEAPEESAAASSSPPSESAPVRDAGTKAGETRPVDAVPALMHGNEAADASALPRSRVPGVGIYAGPLLLVGTAPRATVGGRLGLDFSSGGFGGFVEARGDYPAREQATEGGAVHSAFVGGAFGPCVAYLGLRGCGVLLLGTAPAWATDVDATRAERPFFAAVGARLQHRWTVSGARGLGLIVNADGLKTLTRNQLRLHQADVWQAPAFAAALGIGVDVRFP